MRRKLSKFFWNYFSTKCPQNISFPDFCKNLNILSLVLFKNFALIEELFSYDVWLEKSQNKYLFHLYLEQTLSVMSLNTVSSFFPKVPIIDWANSFEKKKCKRLSWYFFKPIRSQNGHFFKKKKHKGALPSGQLLVAQRLT